MRVFLFAGLALLIGCNFSEKGELIAKAKAAVLAQLRDPDSAKFSDVEAYPEGRLVCGKVNAKNGFGGYAGNDMFAYGEADGAALLSEDLEKFKVLHERCIDAIERHTKSIMANLSADDRRRVQDDPVLREMDNEIAEIDRALSQIDKTQNYATDAKARSQ